MRWNLTKRHSMVWYLLELLTKINSDLTIRNKSNDKVLGSIVAETDIISASGSINDSIYSEIIASSWGHGWRRKKSQTWKAIDRRLKRNLAGFKMTRFIIIIKSFIMCVVSFWTRQKFSNDRSDLKFYELQKDHRLEHRSNGVIFYKTDLLVSVVVGFFNSFMPRLFLHQLFYSDLYRYHFYQIMSMAVFFFTGGRPLLEITGYRITVIQVCK